MPDQSSIARNVLQGFFPENNFLPRIAHPASVCHQVSLFFALIGGHLLSHTVSGIVPSAAQVLTIVFGMGTGVPPERIATEIRVTKVSPKKRLWTAWKALLS